MDNLCHTLVGAAFGEAGLKSRSRWGSPVLMIASNLPDVDVLAYATGTPAVALRRGMTHGMLAQALLPIALTGVVLLLDRWRPRPGSPRARAAPLLLLSYIGVLSHVGLDWLNNYGVRLLMPFSNRWFYGDSVFIIDPWLWLMFAAGIVVARRRALPLMAGASLVAATLYIAGMVWSARVARQDVLDIWTRERGSAPQGLMVGPSFGDPLQRTVIADAGDHYRTGRYQLRGRRLALDEGIVPKNEDHPAAMVARHDRRVMAVLVWARFPYYRIAPEAGGVRVTLGDMRFPARVGGVTVFVPRDNSQ